jgi:hypothetical protein
MTRSLLRRLPGLMACVCICWGAAVAAAADPILDWNQTAAQAITTAVAAGRPSQVSAQSLLS